MRMLSESSGGKADKLITGPGGTATTVIDKRVHEVASGIPSFNMIDNPVWQTHYFAK